MPLHDPQNLEFDVVVIGGGHAGAEAALAAARIGARTALLTMHAGKIATMPCNPAVGGIAKSHLVCELDALGGETGRNADFTGLQYRVLNTRKGPAVRATRVQCDKEAYSRRMTHTVHSQDSLIVIEATVSEIITNNDMISDVALGDGRIIHTKSLVVTPGTFLQGRIHIGKQIRPGGRGDAPSADALGDSIRALGFQTGRLKTGTPPRLHKDSINTSQMEIQDNMEPLPLFSWEAHRIRHMFHVEHSGDLARLFHVEQIHPELIPWIPGQDPMPCYFTRTTQETHDIISANLHQSAMYSGAITGTGVRYCPSIEDKIVKFSHKDSHHVFIEPEGRNTPLVYPNGTSNSLPQDVQARLIHSIPGLEKAEIIQWAYAIEYDFVHPTQLRHTLETKRIGGLFFAGQINGTTGYEEAAAQGFVAGVNAARSALGLPAWILGRHEAYIGVLIDDLVTKGTDEPYRMFTSRAEHRLSLRQDNARFRLLDHAKALGIAARDFLMESDHFSKQITEETDRMERTLLSGDSMSQRLRRADETYRELPDARHDLDPTVIEQLEIYAKYQGYIIREQANIRRLENLEDQRIPADIDYWPIKALSYESREKLSKIRPVSMAQAARISGITPADLAILSVAIHR
jgi:tRNA uridine 5-carboxymethylaminomethyl modification enzyme